MTKMLSVYLIEKRGVGCGILKRKFLTIIRWAPKEVDADDDQKRVKGDSV